MSRSSCLLQSKKTHNAECLEKPASLNLWVLAKGAHGGAAAAMLSVTVD
jgi:hypothetical protein